MAFSDSCGKDEEGGSAHVISAMPMRIEYVAFLRSTYQRERIDGEIYFVQRGKELEVGVPFRDFEQRDGFELRDALFAVANPVEALHFLRGSGEFTNSSARLSWSAFQRWQNLARTMHVATDQESLSAEDYELSRLIAAAAHWPDTSLSHNYFGDSPARDISPAFLAGLTRMAQNETDSPKAADIRLGRLLEQVDVSVDNAARNQRELEARFIRPLPGSYEILWTDEGMPELIFKARNTLEAVAATIHVDRMAGRRYTRCAKKGCGKIILVGSQGTKRFCSRQHMDAARKKEKYIPKVLSSAGEPVG